MPWDSVMGTSFLVCNFSRVFGSSLKSNFVPKYLRKISNKRLKKIVDNLKISNSKDIIKTKNQTTSNKIKDKNYQKTKLK